jgi:transposase
VVRAGRNCRDRGPRSRRRSPPSTRSCAASPALSAARRWQAINGVGSILACHLLAEIGEASRFRRAEQITRSAGLDPVVEESGETRRRGHLAKAGSPHLRWALVEAAMHAHRATAPDLALYRATRNRRDSTIARLTVARKIGKRVYYALCELEHAAA